MWDSFIFEENVHEGNNRLVYAKEVAALENGEYRKIAFSGAYDAGDSLYISNGLFNGILKLDKMSMTAKYIRRFENAGIRCQSLHNKVFRYKDELIFTPNFFNGIHIYNLKQDEVKYYPCVGNKGKRYMDAFVVDDKLWVISAYAEQPIVIFDLVNHTQRAFSWTEKLLSNDIKNRKAAMFLSRLEERDGVIYGVVWKTPYIVQFVMESCEVKLYTVEDRESQLTGIAFDGEFFWLTDARDAYIQKWKPQYKEEVIEKPDIQFSSGVTVYCDIVCYKEQVILIPFSGEDILYVDKSANKIRTFCKIPQGLCGFTDARKTWRRFIYHDIVEDKILRLYPIGSTMMLEIDLQTAEIQGYEFCLEDKWDDEKYKENILYTYIADESVEKYLVETKEIDLDIYLDYISNDKRSKKEVEHAEIGVGTQIWKYIMQGE